MKYVIFTIILAVLKESHPLNPEILKYDHFMKNFEATGRALKQEKTNENLDGSHIMKRGSKTYVPLIPDISNEKAMLRLKDVWAHQNAYFRKMKHCAEDIKNSNGGRSMQQIGWLFNDTEARIDEQIDVLSTVPYKKSLRMEKALDSDLIFQHKKSLEGIEKCLNDHYEFREKDEYEELFRRTLKNAREDLLQGQEEIKRLVSEEQQTTSPATESYS